MNPPRDGGSRRAYAVEPVLNRVGFGPPEAQFVGLRTKPDSHRVEGRPPPVAVRERLRQRTPARNCASRFRNPHSVGAISRASSRAAYFIIAPTPFVRFIEHAMRLFLCEKPSQGRDIARVLGAQQRQNGYCSGANLVVTWCIGHLVEAAPPEAYGPEYKSWSLETLPIIPRRWQLEVKPSTVTQFKIVEKLIASAMEVVIATDADREGELIAREILDLCAYRGPVLRLWLSALNDISIRTALGALKPGRDTLPLYHAALGRSRADWIVGMNLTRLFTLLGRKAGYKGVLSVGRVQTPTLRLVVERDREIENFAPVPYWTIDVELSLGGRSFSAQWIAPKDTTDAEGRCLRSSAAEAAVNNLRRASTAVVVTIKTDRVREAPPLPFDLGTLQDMCSRQLGLPVQETLELAQSLYETHKATTYPRTDSGYLPENMFAEAPLVLAALLATDPELRRLIERLDCTQRSRAWNDAKLTAHHGIIPTLEPIRLSALSGKELAVYRLIRSHYLAQFLPHHEFDRTEAQLTCGPERLRAAGKQITSHGWRIAIDAQSLTDEEASSPQQVLPPLESGTQCQVGSVTGRSLRTQPPKHFTQGDLIKAMKGVARYVTDPRLRQKLTDTSGIGTVATQGAIIQGLINRGFLLQKGRTLRASDAGITLISAVPTAIADPATTALWEQVLDMIALGQVTLDEFVSKQSDWIAQFVRDYSGRTLTISAPVAPPITPERSPSKSRHRRATRSRTNSAR
jgi:DNA topoisomerase-3